MHVKEFLSSAMDAPLNPKISKKGGTSLKISSKFLFIIIINGGGSGIRTHGADEGTTVFKTVTINQTLPSLLCLNAYSIGFVANCNIFDLTPKTSLQLNEITFLKVQSIN